MYLEVQARVWVHLRGISTYVCVCVYMPVGGGGGQIHKIVYP